MNWAHAHLILNHEPVVGLLLVLPILAWGLARRSQDLLRAGLSLLVLLALLSLAVFFTGEPAEELVENLAGVSEPMIERHEEAALFATIALVVVGALSLAGLLSFRRRAIPLRLPAVLLLLSLVPAGAVAWTANLGGQIRHPEIRSAIVVDSKLVTTPAPPRLATEGDR